MIIRTDPRNSDYEVESGATRNFEPWQDEEARVEEEKRKRYDEEMGNSIKVLENKMLDSKRRIEDEASLEERLSMMNRFGRLSYDAMLEFLRREKVEEKRKLDEEDESLARSVFNEQRLRKGIVKRIADEEVENDAMERGFKKGKLDEQQRKLIKVDVLGCKSSGKVDFFKNSSVRVNIKPKAKEEIKNVMESLCQQYEGDDDDDD